MSRWLRIPAIPFVALLLASPPAAAQRRDAPIQLVISKKDPHYVEVAEATRVELARFGYATAPILDARNKKAVLPRRTSFCVTFGTAATRWALSRVGRQGKVVFCMVADAERGGFRKDPRAFGIETRFDYRRQLELGMQIAPKTKTIGVLYRASQESSKREVLALRKALPKGVSLRAVDLDDSESSAAAIRRLLSGDVDFIWSYPDSKIYSRAVQASLLLPAFRQRIPTFGYSPHFVRAGAAIGVGIAKGEQARRAAGLAVQVARALRDDEVPLPKPRIRGPKLLLAVNHRVCAQVGFELPKSWKPLIQWTFGKD